MVKPSTVLEEQALVPVPLDLVFEFLQHTVVLLDLLPVHLRGFLERLRPVLQLLHDLYMRRAGVISRSSRRGLRERERETLALASSSSLSAFSPIWSNSALASSANWVRNADRSSRKSVRRTFWACSMAIRASSSCFRLSPSDGEEESAWPALLELQEPETDLRLLRDVFLWAGDGFGRWRDGCIALRMLMISQYNLDRVSGIVRLPFRLRN
ncbi:hypothetical protein C4D60_Mb03t18710 [Musa balbisiana]|uniref:Uncharacterized protein n=1 Tax=Musa balbisiana TaxID=52838 RepID=A0A4S8JDB7_MUSBA|nr:hypothetical protein C4D60_Mb03t18710 [Musa balbisiana]